MIALKDWKYMETFTPNAVKQYVSEAQMEIESKIFTSDIQTFQKEILFAQNKGLNNRSWQISSAKDIDPYVGYFETNGFNVKVEKLDSWILTVSW